MKSETNVSKEQQFQPETGRILTGIPASPGIAIGIVLLFGSNIVIESIPKPDQVRLLSETEAEAELKRFDNALTKTREELLKLRDKVRESLEDREANIFDAHLLIVDDKRLKKEVHESILREKLSAETVFSKIVQRYITAMSAIEDPYLKERAADIADVSRKIIGHMNGTSGTMPEKLPGQRIIVAHNLTPSDTAMMDRDNVQAFVAETGSRTSHSAILARSMKIPAVVGVADIVRYARSGDMIIVDGNQGTVILDPSQELLKEYAKKEASDEKFSKELLLERQLRPETIDGYRVELAANVDNAVTVGDVNKYGAAGVGLFRTEYLFINEKKAPSDFEQFEVYKKVVQELNGQPLIIRTMDLGGDKLSAVFNTEREANPFLGLRSIRFCLANPELLIPQLRAILRASAFGEIRMMFPMITCEDELDEVLGLVEEVRNDLRKSGLPFDEKMKIGMMIETPAAAIMADRFAKKCDFFSIGTNDLVQYTMAVDRGNEKVARLYRPLHPAILQMIRNTVLAARNSGIWVSVCGEMASDPVCIPLLIGLGIQELSMSPVSIGMARRVIRRMKFFEAEQLANESMQCASQQEVLEKAKKLLHKIIPDFVQNS